MVSHSMGNLMTHLSYKNSENRFELLPDITFRMNKLSWMWQFSTLYILINLIGIWEPHINKADSFASLSDNHFNRIMQISRKILFRFGPHGQYQIPSTATQLCQKSHLHRQLLLLIILLRYHHIYCILGDNCQRNVVLLVFLVFLGAGFVHTCGRYNNDNLTGCDHSEMLIKEVYSNNQCKIIKKWELWITLFILNMPNRVYTAFLVNDMLIVLAATLKYSISATGCDCHVACLWEHHVFSAFYVLCLFYRNNTILILLH